MSSAKPKKQTKAVIGAPTKYRKKYCEEFVELSHEGKTNAQIAAHWGVDRDSLDNWARANPPFFGALKKGKTALEAWFTNFGMNIAGGKMPKANVTAYIWLSKNCIDWRDKRDIQHSIDDIEFEDDDEN